MRGHLLSPASSAHRFSEVLVTKPIPSYSLPELTPAERQFWHSCVDMLGTATTAGNRREPQTGGRVHSG